MEVCSKVHLEEDRVNAIKIVTVYAIDFATFSVKLFGSDWTSKMRNRPQCENIVRNLGIRKKSAGNYMADDQLAEDVLQMTSPTLIGHL